MGTLTAIDAKAGVRTQANSIPTIAQAQDLQDRLDEMVSMWADLWNASCKSDHREYENAREKAVSYLASDRLTQLQKDFEAWTSPASPKQISTMLAGLIGAFPHGQPPQPEIFARTLLEDVASMRPSVYAVDAMCRTLRRTQKFMPSISEALEALKTAEANVEPKQRFMARLLDGHVERCEEKFRGGR